MLDPDKQKNQIKLIISRKTIDWIIEFVAIVFLALLIIIPLYFAKDLPDKIPVHFDIKGAPDSYGGQASLWLLPVMGVIMYIGLTILERFPQIYNYPVKITPENIVRQYTLATRLIRFLKTFILILFSFLSWQIIRTATGIKSGLGKTFLPVFLVITAGIIIIYLVRSLNNRYTEQD
jgi:uncharacterized membrane protein